MPYIKLKVRSGGIYIRQEDDWKPVKLEMISHPKDKSQKVLELVRDSSIKGLFSYLMGETKKIKEIENSRQSSIKIFNLTLDKIVQTSKYKTISEPYITTFFERKDTHRKKSKFTTPPSIYLYQHTFETADPTIKLLQKPINSVLKSTAKSLGEIHSVFKSHIIKNKEQEKYRNLQNNKEKLSQALNNIPQSKLKNSINIALKRIEDEKFISTKVITLIKEISNLCFDDKDFFERVKKSSYGKFSIFTDLSSTKQWVNTKYHPIVRGMPAFLACVDFDIYLSKEAFTKNQTSNHFNWKEVIDKIKRGPNISRWGEGGIVFVDYTGLDEMGCPYEDKDAPFVEIDALRKAGMKIEKYDWEIEKKATEKTTKRKR